MKTANICLGSLIWSELILENRNNECLGGVLDKFLLLLGDCLENLRGGLVFLTEL